MEHKTPADFNEILYDALESFRQQLGMEERNTDCFFCSAFQDGPATIVECRLKCASCKNCKMRITSKDADKIVVKYLTDLYSDEDDDLTLNSEVAVRSIQKKLKGE